MFRDWFYRNILRRDNSRIFPNVYDNTLSINMVEVMEDSNNYFWIIFVLCMTFIVMLVVHITAIEHLEKFHHESLYKGADTDVRRNKDATGTDAKIYAGRDKRKDA
jgi:hypothetical protein